MLSAELPAVHHTSVMSYVHAFVTCRVSAVVSDDEDDDPDAAIADHDEAGTDRLDAVAVADDESDSEEPSSSSVHIRTTAAPSRSAHCCTMHTGMSVYQYVGYIAVLHCSMLCQQQGITTMNT